MNHWIKPTLLLILVSISFNDTLNAKTGNQKQKEQKTYEVSAQWLIDLYIQASDAAALQKNSITASEGLRLRAESSLDTVFSASASYDNDGREQANSIFASDSETEELSVGVSKQFASGTQVTADLSTSNNQEQQIDFSTGSGSDTEYKQTILSLTAKQSLLRNSFGAATRAGIDSAIATQNSTVSQARSGLEDQVAALVDQYYLAWTAFRTLESARDRVQREERRTRTYRRQYSKGFITEAEMLQLESSLISAKNEVTDADQDIRDILIQLGTSVKMDLISLYRQNSSSFVFAKENYQDISQACQEAPPLMHSYDINTTQHRLAAAQRSLQQAQSNKKPDLFLDLRLNANGIEEDYGDSFSEAIELSNLNYYVGIGFEFNFDSSSAQADHLDALQDIKENKIQSRQEQATLQQDWLIHCDLASSLIEKKGNLEQKASLEKSRIRILDREFNVSKVDLNTVVSAEDTLSSTNSQIHQVTSELNQTAWKIRRQLGAFSSSINEYIKN